MPSFILIHPSVWPQYYSTPTAQTGQDGQDRQRSDSIGEPSYRRSLKTVRLCYGTVVSPVLSVCDVGALWPNGWMYQDATWHGGRPWLRPHCVRRGPSSPPKKGHSTQFSAHVWCGQTAGWIKMPLGMEVGLGPGDCVRWGPSSPPQKGGTQPQFSAHVYCGQTAGWIKMPLGTKVGLGPRDIVVDGGPAPPKGAQLPPNFRPMPIVAKRSPISATAELLWLFILICS